MPAVQHMVVLKFKSETPQQTIDDLFNQVAALRDSIDGITHFSGGPYASPEGLHGGFTHGFLMTFESPKARDAYLPHAEHELVKQAILPRVDDAIAFDFETD